MQDKIIITGIGCISPWGDDLSSFFKNLKEENTQIKQINDFDIKKYIKRKGLRTLPKSTKMAIASTKLALDDPRNTLLENWDAERTGVFVGNSMSYLNNINDFLQDFYTDGADVVSPLKFPNTVLNNISGWVSIIYNIQGINSTVNTGNTSGIDAIIQAKSYIETGIIDKAIVIAVEDIQQGVLHNESKLLEDRNKITEMAITIILEKEQERQENYATICDVESWMEHTYQDGKINENLGKFIKELETVDNIILGSGNKVDSNILQFLKENNSDINVENTFPDTGISYSVSGMIKLLMAIFRTGQTLIIETNETGNNSFMLVENYKEEISNG